MRTASWNFQEATCVDAAGAVSFGFFEPLLFG